MQTPFNPLARFTAEMIPGFLEMKARYLVAQTYRRGEVPDSPRIPLLFCDYSDLAKAYEHFGKAKTTDQWASIIDLSNPKHSTKLLEMCEPGSKYRLFVAFLEDDKGVALKLKKRIETNVKSYIDNQTNWSPGRNDAVKADLQLKFGHLFVTLKYKGQQIQIKLSELEGPCATISVLPPPSESYRIIFQASNSILR